MTPKSELGPDFVQCTYPKFHHPMFTRSEVIVLTNKQMPLKTSNVLCYATALGKHTLIHTDRCNVTHFCEAVKKCLSSMAAAVGPLHYTMYQSVAVFSSQSTAAPTQPLSTV